MVPNGCKRLLMAVLVGLIVLPLASKASDVASRGLSVEYKERASAAATVAGDPGGAVERGRDGNARAEEREQRALDLLVGHVDLKRELGVAPFGADWLAGHLVHKVEVELLTPGKV